MTKYLAAAAVVVALAVAAVALWPSGSDNRSPREVVGAFVYHIDRGNFAKACGLMTREAGGPIESCSDGFVYNAAMNLVIFGADIYEGAKLLPGEPVENKDGSLVYRIRTRELPPVKVTVAEQDSGRWRITRIG